MQPVEYQSFVEKNLRHNFTVNVLDGAFFWFGNSFWAPAIILPVFLAHFTDNPVILGLIPFVSTAGYLIPQLFTSRWVERAPIKKVFPVNWGFWLERVPIALLAPATYFLATSAPTWTVVVTLLLFAWHTVGAGFVMVGWQDMIAKVIPTTLRGRYFGLTNFLGTGTGIAGALAVTWLLSKTTFPMGYVWAFAIGAVTIMISWWFLSRTREPADPYVKETQSVQDYFRNIPQVLKENKNFSRYLISAMITTIGWMANGFLVIYAFQHWNLPDERAAAFTVLYQIGQAAGNPLFGWLGDRFGHKLNLIIATAVNITALLLAVIAPDPFWFFVVFFLRGVNQAGSFLSSTSIVMEFGEPKIRPTLIGLANTLPGVTGGIAPLLGGWLAMHSGYPTLFLLAAAFGLLALLVLARMVREPRTNPKQQSAL